MLVTRFYTTEHMKLLYSFTLQPPPLMYLPIYLWHVGYNWR